MPVSVGEAVGYLDLDISGFLKGLKEANEQAESKTTSLTSTVERNLNKTGKKMTKAGKIMTAGITTPIVAAGVSVVKTTANFDTSMSRVAAVSGAAGDSLLSLREKALEMGAKTKFSASEAADAMNYMAMAGWKTESMLDGIEGIMNLAAASGEDLATTSDIVTDALTAFGLTAKDSGRFADILAAASSNANTNVSMMGESFKYVAPMAGALGYSAEDVSIALGLMANSGIKASQAGTSLRTLLANMSDPTDEVAGAMEKLGISLEDGEGNMYTFREVMNQMREGFGSLKISEEELTSGLDDLAKQYEDGTISESEYKLALDELMKRAYGAEAAMKAQTAAQLSGKMGLSGLLAIVNASQEDYDKLTEAIDGSTGAAQKMADVMQDNLEGRITILKSNLEGLAIQLGELIIPYVEKVVAFLQKLIAWFAGLSSAQQENIIKWAAFAAALGPSLIAIGKVVSAVGILGGAFGKIPLLMTKVKGAFTVVQTAIAGVSAPVVALVAIVGTLIAAFVNLWTTNEGFRNSIIEIWNNIKETFDNLVSQIAERFSGLGISFTTIIETLKAVWNGFCEILAPVFIAAFEIVQEVFQLISDSIISVLDMLIGLFTGNWEQFLNGVKGTWESIWKFIKSLFETVVNMIKGILNTFCSWFGLTWEQTWNTIKQFLVNVWNAMKTTVSSALSFIGNKITSGMNAARSTITNVLNAIGDKFTSIWNGAKTTVSSAIEKIKGMFNFSWSLPKIPLPHFSVSGSFGWSLDGGVQLPHVSVDWYKKAMGSGMILDSPTIFGFDAKTGKFLGGGEAGQEVVVGAKNLLSMIRVAVKEAFEELIKDPPNKPGPQNGGFDYMEMARAFASVMRDTPIINNTTFEVQSGDVEMDGEKVGRHLAPVINRVLAQ